MNGHTESAGCSEGNGSVTRSTHQRSVSGADTARWIQHQHCLEQRHCVIWHSVPSTPLVQTIR
jgi:hypothetical protein